MKKRFGPKSVATALVLATAAPYSAVLAAAPDVVATVRPIHSLVASVMDGVAEPKLLLDGSESPHSYNLTPSDAHALSNADLVVWIGEPMETFLQRPLVNLASEASILELVSDAGLNLRDNREGAVWQTEGHDHGGDHSHDHDHEHEHNHDHDNDHDHDHSHDQRHDHDEGHAHGDGHVHHAIDGHVWLDPNNARAIVDAVAAKVSEIDAENAAQYSENAAQTKARIDQAEAQVRERLNAYRDKPFLTSHDALQYFDQYFGLEAVGAVTITPDRAPSARRVSELRTTVESLGATCIFSEPGYEPRVIQVISEAADVKLGIVDPLGVDVPVGSDLYFNLMTGLADSLADCLGDEDA